MVQDDTVDSVGNQETFVGKKASATTPGWRISMQVGTNVLGMYRNDNSPQSSIFVHTDDNTFTVGEWFHCAVVKASGTAASTVQIYLNGIVQSVTELQDNLTGTILNNEQVTIGSAEGAANWLDGTIDDVGIWTGVLSSNTIYDLKIASNHLANVIE